jgi:hypothetical protein
VAEDEGSASSTFTALALERPDCEWIVNGGFSHARGCCNDRVLLLNLELNHVDIRSSQIIRVLFGSIEMPFSRRQELTPSTLWMTSQPVLSPNRIHRSEIMVGSLPCCPNSRPCPKGERARLRLELAVCDMCVHIHKAPVGMHMTTPDGGLVRHFLQ